MTRNLRVCEENLEKNVQRRKRIKRNNHLPRLIAAGLAAVTIFSVTAFSGHKKDTETTIPAEKAPLEQMLQTEVPEVSLEQINDLNIIINDNGCEDNFIDGVCKRLEENGIEYSFSQNNENINVDDSVVISIDQEYITDVKFEHGIGAQIIAQYANNNNDSDALAIAMGKCFSNTDVYCGKLQYTDLKDAGRMPSSTESAIDKDKNTSQVTLCFAKDSWRTPSNVADNITEALGRFAAYKAENLDVDLLVRAGGDCNSAWGLADRFNCTVDEVRKYNNMENPQLDQTIFNPAIEKINAFNGEIKVVDNAKTNTNEITFGN